MAGLPVFTAGLLTSGIPFFVSEFELGRALGLTVALTLVAVVVARAASRPGMVGFAAVVARTAVVCAARVPEHARHQVRVEYQVVPQHFTIVERRAPWREESARYGPAFPSHACATQVRGALLMINTGSCPPAMKAPG